MCMLSGVHLDEIFHGHNAGKDAWIISYYQILSDI